MASVAVFLAASVTSTGRPARADSITPGPEYELYSPTTSVVRNADGTLTADIHSTPVQTVDPSSPSGWTPIDLSLQATSGGYEPDNADAQVTFSDGGNDSAPVATLAQNDTSLSVGLDAVNGVPAPVVAGDTATYPAVAPGVDATLRATAAGFETSYVVTSQADAPATLSIPLQLNGLNASLAIDGSLVLTDGTGTQVGGAEPAKMWGAQVDPVTGEPTVQETVPASLIDGTDGPVLQLTPDWTAPGLTFPATVDPTVNLSLLLDTSVSEDFPTISYGTATTLRSGRWSTSQRYRSYIGFDRATIANTHIQAATLTLHETGSASCTGTRIDLMSVASGPQPPYTWNSQPTVGSVYASTTAAKGFSSSCPAGDITLSTGGDSSLVLTDLVQLWANGTTTPAIIGLRAHEETSSANNTGKIFTSSDAGSNGPVLSVTYSYPEIPTDVSVTDAGLSPVTFHATFTDSDPNVTGWVQYKLVDSSQTAVVNVAPVSGTAVTSGSDSAYTIPAGTLVYGTTYTVTARATDGTAASDWSASASYVYGDPWPGLSVGMNANTFVVQCAYAHQLPGFDPIQSQAPAEDTFGNNRTGYPDPTTDTEAYQESAVADIHSATEASGNLATFTAPAGKTFSFAVNQLVWVHDVEVNGSTANSYNTTQTTGPWQVHSRPTSDEFTAYVAAGTTDSTQDTGSVGDAGLRALTLSTESYSSTDGYGTFTLPTSTTSPFSVDQTVVVRGTSGLDGSWTVRTTGGQTFTAFPQFQLSDASSSVGGVADQGLSCGMAAGKASPGALTYDSAAYWDPSFYKSDGSFLTPVRQRDYYLGLPASGSCSTDTQYCLTDLPAGMQITGGNPQATDPAENSHAYWTCGRKTVVVDDGHGNKIRVLYPTPALDHPYDCTPFHDLPANFEFVDGPVGVVDLRRCYDGDGTSSSDVEYPDEAGSTTIFCPLTGYYHEALPLISIRTHIGSLVGDLAQLNPCTVTCLAYVATYISDPAHCPIHTSDFCQEVDVELNPTYGPELDLTTSSLVEMYGIPGGASTTSRGGFTIDKVQGQSAWIDISTQGSVPPCGTLGDTSTICGTIADDIGTNWSDIAFSIAGCDTSGNCDHLHPFYDLSAGFWNTWSQDDLHDLELYCLDDLPSNPTDCIQMIPGEAVIASNHDVECLPSSC